MASPPSDAGTRAVLEADERWISRFNARDLDGVLSLYGADVVVMPPGEPGIRGREAVRRWMEAFFDRNTARQTLVNDEAVVAGDWAFLRGRFRLEVEPRDGGEARTLEGKHLVIWRRRADGSWKAVRDIWNYDA